MKKKLKSVGIQLKVNLRHQSIKTVFLLVHDCVEG